MESKFGKLQSFVVSLEREAINEKIILFAGRVGLVKGIFSLIKCFKEVLNKYPNCRLVVVGTVFDPSNTLKLTKDIASKITFTGQIDKEQLRKWYSVANIGVLPSYLEQCSYTGIEMMMNRLSIVASDGFCVKDMFRNKKNALIAKIGNRESSDIFEKNLAENILEFLNSDELCHTISSQAREVYETNYTSDTMEQDYRNLLKLIH